MKLGHEKTNYKIPGYRQPLEPTLISSPFKGVYNKRVVILSFVATNKIELEGSFDDLVYQIKNEKPTKIFAASYLKDAKLFYSKIDAYRKTVVSHV